MNKTQKQKKINSELGNNKSMLLIDDQKELFNLVDIQYMKKRKKEKRTHWWTKFENTESKQ